jgi:hypothetical protein
MLFPFATAQIDDTADPALRHVDQSSSGLVKCTTLADHSCRTGERFIRILESVLELALVAGFVLFVEVFFELGASLESGEAFRFFDDCVVGRLSE